MFCSDAAAGFEDFVMRRLGIAAALTVLLAVSARAEILVTVSKSDQQMSVAVNGTPTYRWAVSTGVAGRDTPVGSYKAIRLERVYYSSKFDSSPMPNSVFFHGGYAIHGTNEADKLGQRASHGCVRLSRANAETLMHLVKAHGMAATNIVIKDGSFSGVMAQAPKPAAEKAPVIKVADREVRPRDEPKDEPRRESRAEPRYDPRLAPYSAPRDPRDEPRGPYSAPRDPRSELRDEPRGPYSAPRDPRDDLRREDARRDEPRDRRDLREPPRERRNATRDDLRREDLRRRDDRDSRRRVERDDRRYDRRPPPRYREPPRQEARRALPRSRTELLREYEQLERRQAEIERELTRSRERGLRAPVPRDRYREPPRDNTRERYSGPPQREPRDLRSREREDDLPPARREPPRSRDRYSSAEAR